MVGQMLVVMIAAMRPRGIRRIARQPERGGGVMALVCVGDEFKTAVSKPLKTTSKSAVYHFANGLLRRSWWINTFADLGKMSV